MSGLYDLWEKLSRSKRYREAFAASVVKRMIPLQIRVLRKQHGWSQVQLANESKLTQGVISRAEDPDYGNLTVNTLVRIGTGFDCAFVGRFVPFSELATWYTALANERAFKVPTFGEDLGFMRRTEPGRRYLQNKNSTLAFTTNAVVDTLQKSWTQEHSSAQIDKMSFQQLGQTVDTAQFEVIESKQEVSLPMFSDSEVSWPRMVA